MIFASDTWSGASDKVIAALSDQARAGGPAYGSDPLTRRVEERFSAEAMVRGYADLYDQVVGAPA